MTNPVVVTEARGDRAVPTLVIPGWAEEFGVIAGVTARGSEPGGFDLGLASDQPTKLVLPNPPVMRRFIPPLHLRLVGRVAAPAAELTPRVSGE